MYSDNQLKTNIYPVASTGLDRVTDTRSTHTHPRNNKKTDNTHTHTKFQGNEPQATEDGIPGKMRNKRGEPYSCLGLL